MNVHNALIATYCENPCQVLPNALWKTLAQLEHWRSSVNVEKGIVTQLEAWSDENNLMVYWTRCRNQLPDFGEQPTDFAIIHQDYLPRFPATKFAVRTPYFRLIHRPGETEQRASLPVGFSFADVKVQQEAEQVSSLIGQCYADLHPSAETVMGWLDHPTFDPSLWVWVMDDHKKIPVGLGIAEMDQTIQEGSLEWVQVLPAYRGIGMGKSLVQELLARLEKRVKFTTVSGEVDNLTKPEALYRSCGFIGDDVWWLLGNG